MLTTKDVKNIFKTAGSEKNSGGLPILYDKDKVYTASDFHHTLVIGETGSKKSRLIGMPMVVNLLMASENVVVSDPKGEIYNYTHKVAEDEGYKIIKFDFTDLKNSDTWNPLTEIENDFRSGDLEKAWVKAEQFWTVVNSPIKQNKDPYWDKTAIELLTNIFKLYFITVKKKHTLTGFYRFYNNIINLKCNEDGELSFPESLYVYEEIHDEITKNLTPIIINIEKNPYMSTANVAKTTLDILALNTPNISHLLMKNSFEYTDFDKEKTIVYLITPDDNSIFDIYVNVFVSKTYSTLSAYLKDLERDSLDIRLNYVLDEFANIPKINDFDKFISMSRSKNIRFTLLIQNIGQLDNYGENLKETIIGNCSNIAYLYSKEKKTNEFIYDFVSDLISFKGISKLDKDNGEVIMKLDRNKPYIATLMDIDDVLKWRNNKI